MIKADTLEEYLEQVVTSQEEWIQKLFKRRRVIFTVDPSGTFGLELRKSVPELQRSIIKKRIADYMETHPFHMFEGDQIH